MTVRTLSTFVLLPVLLARPACLTGQSRADTLAVRQAIRDLIVQEAAPSNGGHRGPFELVDSCASAWAPPVYALIRSSHPELVAQPSPYAVKFKVERVVVMGDTTRAFLSWSQCTVRDQTLNYWKWTITYVFVRAGTAWHFAGKREASIADGHC